MSRHVQVGRFRHLAHSALAAYDLGAACLTLLAPLSNTTFRVNTADGRRYVLRIHRAGTPTIESVGAELAWLTALRRDTNLEVPTPVPARSGKLLTVTATPDVPTPHICVLFRWFDGRRLNAGLTPTHMQRTGAFMARLQDHATQFGPPPEFARGRVDGLVAEARTSEMNRPGREGLLPDPFAPAVVAACHTLVANTLSAEAAALLKAVIDRVCAAEQILGQGAATFGLIHADMHHYNLLFARGTVRVIDFDDCGFGPMLYDLAVPLAMLQDRAEYPALRAGLMAGYRRVRPLPAEHEAYLDTFIALRLVQDALWVLETRHHPAIGDDWATQARHVLAPLTAFLEAGSRFPALPPPGSATVQKSEG